MSVCLSIYLTIYQSIYLYVCLSIYLYVYLSVYIGIYLSISNLTHNIFNVLISCLSIRYSITSGAQPIIMK